MEFLEVPVFDDDLYKMLVRFAINAFFLALMLIFAVYPGQRERAFAFTAVMMNVTVFFICFTMKKLELSIGMALGLFAIFAVLRYRTDAIRVKEMTYLFVIIGIAVINSLSNRKTSYAELAVVNLLILGTAILKERIVGSDSPAKNKGKGAKNKKGAGKLVKLTIEYDKLEWLGAAHRDELLGDLRRRTGLDVVKVRVRNIDLTKSLAILNVWYNDPAAPPE
ncbi:MAG: DUF4956 domain-containing protein [Pirellulales bacterium]